MSSKNKQQPQLASLFQENLSNSSSKEDSKYKSSSNITVENENVNKKRLMQVAQLQQKNQNQSISESDNECEIDDCELDKTLLQKSPSVRHGSQLKKLNKAKSDALEDFQNSVGQSLDQEDISQTPNNSTLAIRDRKILISRQYSDNPKRPDQSQSPPCQEEVDNKLDESNKHDMSEIAIELNAPKLKSYKSNRSKISNEQSFSKQKINSIVYKSPTSEQMNGKRKFETPQPLPVIENQITKQADMPNLSHRVVGAILVVEDENVMNDTYHDADSLIMSERGDITTKNINTKNSNRLERRAPMPLMYQSIMKMPSNNLITEGSDNENQPNKVVVPYKVRMSDNSHQLRIRNKALMPVKKNMDFTAQNFGSQDGADVLKLNDEESGLIIISQRQRPVDDLEQACSYLSWEPKDFHLEGEDFIGQMTKSQPFSIAYQQDIEYNQNIFEDCGETRMFSLLQQTPKYTLGSTIKKNLQMSQLNSVHKSSIYLETLNNQNPADEPTMNLNRLTVTQGGDNQVYQNVSKFYNTQASMMQAVGKKKRQMQLIEAQANGRRVRQELEYSQYQDFKEYSLPSGFIIIDKEGPLSIQDSQLQEINGVNGSQVFLGQNNSLVFKNQQSDQLTIKIVQFELASPMVVNDYDTPKDHSNSLETVLINIIQDEESEHKDDSEVVTPRTKTIIFQDCAFIQDGRHEEMADVSPSFLSKKCMIAVKVQNFSKHVNYDIQFVNCIFLGYHHAIVCNEGNISISTFSCTFKKQKHESIIGIDLKLIKLSQSIFKKSTLSDCYKSAVMLQYNEKQQSKDPKIIDIQGSTFRKCQGIALTVVGNEQEVQKLSFFMKDSKFSLNQGQTAVKFENLQGFQYGRFDYRESNLTNNYHSTNPSPERLQKQDQMIKIMDCEVLDNKRNGIEINNVLAGFSIKRCNFKENKYSGVYINQIKTDTETAICNCCLKAQVRLTENFKTEGGESQLLMSQSPSKLVTKQTINNISKISECLISMNQMHGIEIKNYKQNDLKIEQNTLEDNFCDGINVLQDEGLEDHSVLDLNNSKNKSSINISRSPSKMTIIKRNLRPQMSHTKLHLGYNKIKSNKNCGLYYASPLNRLLYSYLIGNVFENNLNTDVFVQEESVFKMIFFLKLQGKQSNTLEQPIQKGFDNEEGQQNYIQLTCTEDSQTDDFKQKNKKSIKKYSGSVESSGNKQNRKPMNKRQSMSACFGKICKPSGNIRGHRYKNQSGQDYSKDSTAYQSRISYQNQQNQQQKVSLVQNQSFEINRNNSGIASNFDNQNHNRNDSEFFSKFNVGDQNNQESLRNVSASKQIQNPNNNQSKKSIKNVYEKSNNCRIF
ncbi:UNKNOWN [Stylonychia lemnae]|uniref:Right handed beta helix domain-containing protein n=1 Tax=Stylonychia lemnae TaxID=5949 RepID=A0A078AXZ3_STYLE|nr:UNKNOWN [Stylonychia lemnae]|eukprot:CDW86961.1 UNKNOWN [Stylonychia lemnae]